MEFERSYILWFLAAIPLHISFSIISYRSSNRWLFLFARTRKHSLPFFLNTLLLSFSFACLTVALASPKVHYKRTVFNRSGIELALGIDVSKSMLAEDVDFPGEGRRLFAVPNRLNRARFFALEFLSELHGEQIGIFVFASKAVDVVPFTRDYGYCRYVLKHIGETDITIPGSNLGEAILEGVSLVESSGGKGMRVLILISDGEDISADKSFLHEAVQLAGRKRLIIYTVGVGGGKGALIPMRGEQGKAITNYYLDEAGSYLKTSLVEDTLKQIAADTGGQYYRVTGDNLPRGLIETILKQAKTVKETKEVERAWFDLSPLFLIATLVFFASGMFC
jgi:Ca-activated chloride channel homolog